MNSEQRKLWIRKKGIIKTDLTRIEIFVDEYSDREGIHIFRVRQEGWPRIWEEYHNIPTEL
jgi:hypothetical protein